MRGYTNGRVLVLFFNFMKYLHVEHNKYGTYVYFNDKKRKSTLFTIEDIENDCCIADGEQKVDMCIDVEDIVHSADIKQRIKMAKKHTL